MARGLLADAPTVIATWGLLNRSLRIGQTDTDRGYETIARTTDTTTYEQSNRANGGIGIHPKESRTNTDSRPSQLLSEMNFLIE